MKLLAAVAALFVLPGLIAIGILDALALVGGCALAVLFAAAIWPRVSRFLAACLLAWAAAWEDWAKARHTHWTRYSGILRLETRTGIQTLNGGMATRSETNWALGSPGAQPRKLAQETPR